MIDEILIYRYRQEFHLSYRQVLEEPQAALEQAYLIWSLESDKQDMDRKRDEADSNRGRLKEEER